MGDEDDRTCYVCNFTSKVTSDLLEELFTQVGPVEKVMLTDKISYRFAMVLFEDEESVPFAVETLDGIKLFNTPLRVKPRNGSKHESAYRSVSNAKRSELYDDSPFNWQSNSRKRDSIGKMITSDEDASSPSDPVLPAEISDSNFSSSSKAPEFSTPRRDPGFSARSKFTRRPDSDRRRTFPVKPSESRLFESVPEGQGRWCGKNKGRPYSYRDWKYTNNSKYRSNYEFK